MYYINSDEQFLCNIHIYLIYHGHKYLNIKAIIHITATYKNAADIHDFLRNLSKVILIWEHTKTKGSSDLILFLYFSELILESKYLKLIWNNYTTFCTEILLKKLHLFHSFHLLKNSIYYWFEKQFSPQNFTVVKLFLFFFCYFSLESFHLQDWYLNLRGLFFETTYGIFVQSSSLVHQQHLTLHVVHKPL